MADNNSYPLLSAKNWWSIRKKFKQTIPGTVTSNYLSSILNMQERSANNNVLPYLRQIGIIDQEGKTGQRAKLWRDDTEYPKVCDEIKKVIYPQELLDIPYSPEDKESIKRWFSQKTGTGEKTVAKMAAFYFLLCEKDPSKEPNDLKASVKSEKVRSVEKNPVKKTVERGQTAIPNTSSNTTRKEPKDSEDHLPAIHINFQIHISSDASPEQIEKIFENMDKYIYRRKDILNE